MHGLNHRGVVSRARYDAAAPPSLSAEKIHPPTRSIIVVGSGGRDHWRSFLEHVAHDPIAHLARTSHPLDDFCASLFSGLAGCRVIFPTQAAPPGFDFMKLAELAGLGAPSEIGTLVCEPFGPWLGLRAAIFSPEVLPDSPPARRMCDGCPAPCRAACPVGAVGPEFDWRRCVDERLRPGSGCRPTCHARRACIVAPEHAYDELEMLYHYDRPEGRRRLCEKFGVSDEAGAG